MRANCSEACCSAYKPTGAVQGLVHLQTQNPSCLPLGEVRRYSLLIFMISSILCLCVFLFKISSTFLRAKNGERPHLLVYSSNEQQLKSRNPNRGLPHRRQEPRWAVNAVSGLYPGEAGAGSGSECWTHTLVWDVDIFVSI